MNTLSAPNAIPAEAAGSNPPRAIEADGGATICCKSDLLAHNAFGHLPIWHDPESAKRLDGLHPCMDWARLCAAFNDGAANTTRG